jgi:hypothetical protein
VAEEPATRLGRGHRLTNACNTTSARHAMEQKQNSGTQGKQTRAGMGHAMGFVRDGTKSVMAWVESFHGYDVDNMHV